MLLKISHSAHLIDHFLSFFLVELGKFTMRSVKYTVVLLHPCSTIPSPKDPRVGRKPLLTLGPIPNSQQSGRKTLFNTYPCCPVWGLCGTCTDFLRHCSSLHRNLFLKWTLVKSSPTLFLISF